MEKRLFRSVHNRLLCGVCGGLGEFFHIDPTIVRLLWVLFGLVGVGILFYIAAALIIPTQY